MKNKYIFYIILCLIIFAGATYRYNIVNKDIPKEYMIDEYCINDEISLDNISLKVNSFKIEQRHKEIDGDDNKEATLNVVIKNTSNKELDVREIVESSKLSRGIYYQDYCNASGDVQKINRLSANDEMRLTLKYILFSKNISKVDEREEYRFYISKDLYKDEIQNKEKELKLYGKYISLGVDYE